jgi:phage gp36-like protein
MFHLDGRLALTLPALFLKPGGLAKDYMEGRIVRHVPPFRTFLVALLLFIFAAEHAIHSAQHHAEEEAHRRAEILATPQGRAAEAVRLRAEAAKDRDAGLKEAAQDRDAALAAAAVDRDADLKDPDEDRAKVLERHQKDTAKAAADYQKATAKAQADYAQTIATADQIAAGKLPEGMGLTPEETRKAEAAKIRSLSLNGEVPSVTVHGDGQVQANATLPPDAKAALEEAGAQAHAPTKAALKTGDWLKESIAKARENPEFYVLVLFTWGHRMAVLLLPIVGLALTLVYRNKPKFFIYDHLLVAMNLLSFAFLTNALGLVLPDALKTWWFGLLVLWTPVNLFQTLRGAYGSSIVGAALKTLIVWWATVFSFSLLLVGLALLALAQI